MSLIPIVSDEEASSEQAVLFEHCTKMLGRVANALRVASHSPKVAQALLGFMIPAIREEVTGVLGIRIKALAILKTSMLNGCDYCVGHNIQLGHISHSPSAFPCLGINPRGPKGPTKIHNLLSAMSFPNMTVPW